MKIDTTISCCLCSDNYKTSFDIPDDWNMRYPEVYEEQGFCPKHLKVAHFADAQCPGCVGSWGDCSLWKAFAYSKPSITETHLNSIRHGICPFRTNGTFTFDSEDGEVKPLDISKIGANENGECLATSILEYIEKYKGEG